METEITVEELFNVVARAYGDALWRIDKEYSGALPPLKSATLTVSTTLEGTDNAEAKILVLSADTKHTAKSAQTITVGLTRPPPPAARVAQFEGPKNLYPNLVRALVASAVAAKAARAAKIGDLILASVTAAIGFDVVRSSGGGLEFEIKFLDVGLKLGAKVSFERAASHTIEIVFEQ